MIDGVSLVSKRHMEYSVDLSVEETIAALQRSPARIGKAWYGDVVEILYEGKWRRLCRTDLKDDVCTGTCEKIADASKVIAEYEGRVHFGARITDERIAIVDSFSDG